MYSIERLEDRVLLAAIGGVRGNTLLIASDNSSDTVEIVGGSTQGTLMVSLSGGVAQEVTGVKNIKIAMAGGNDTVDLIDINIAGNLMVDLGDGDDVLNISGSQTNIGGNVSLWGGNGADTVTIDATGSSGGESGPITIGKNLMVDLGNGVESQADTFQILGADADERTTINGNAIIRGRGADQIIQIDSTSIGKNFRVDLGDGNDVVNLGTASNAALSVNVGGNAMFKLGTGDDQVNLLGGTPGAVTFARNLMIDLGHDDGNSNNGGDTLSMVADDSGTEQITVGGNLVIKGGNGVQTVNLDGVDVGKNANVKLGGGDDVLQVGQAGGSIPTTVAGNMVVNLGDGNDAFRAASLTIGKNLNANGGRGTNDQALETNPGTVTVGGKQNIRAFEAGNL